MPTFFKNKNPIFLDMTRSHLPYIEKF
jgi:hypothetical protein